MEAIPHDEQIKIILEGRAFRTAQELLATKSPGPSDYAKLFTVTRREIQAYVRANGLPASVFFGPSGVTGCVSYRIEEEEDGRYVVFSEERGYRYEEFRYANRKDAELVLVGMMLGPSGIGLY